MELPEQLERRISLYERGWLTKLELRGAIEEFVYCTAEAGVDVLDCLASHSDETVRETAADLRDRARRKAEQVTRIDLIRLTSPLRPGTRLTLSGGHSPGKIPWLKGRKHYKATFIGFAERRAGEMPVALVQLDDEIELTEFGGLRHKGRYALLKLTFDLADWQNTETVNVHVVETLPEDVAAFYALHPWGTEIESHARYSIDDG